MALLGAIRRPMIFVAGLPARTRGKTPQNAYVLGLYFPKSLLIFSFRSVFFCFRMFADKALFVFLQQSIRPSVQFGESAGGFGPARGCVDTNPKN